MADKITLPSGIDERIWASTATTNFIVDPDTQIPNKYNLGYMAEPANPAYFNFYNNRLNLAVANIVQRGVSDFDSETTYFEGFWARSKVNYKVYTCLNNYTTQGDDPALDGGANWVRLDSPNEVAISKNVQMFADYKLENVVLDSNSAIMKKDASNFTESDDTKIAIKDLSNVLTTDIKNRFTGGGATSVNVNSNNVIQITTPVIKTTARDYVATGSSNTIILSAINSEQPPTQYYNGMTITFKAIYDNSVDGVIININGLGNKSILNIDGSLIKAGEILQNDIINAIYNGTSFVILYKYNSNRGVTSDFIEYEISLSNTTPNATVNNVVDISNTPLKNCKTLLVEQSVLLDDVTESTYFEAGVRFVNNTSIRVSHIRNNKSVSNISSSSIINVSNDLIELYCINGDVVLGGCNTGVKILGGYQ